MEYEVYEIDIVEAEKVILGAMIDSAKDQRDMGEATPEPDIERHGSQQGWAIYTRWTRDADKCHNGGDYTFWTDVWVDEDGLHISEEWSADWDIRDYSGREWFCEGVTAARMDDLVAKAREKATNEVRSS